MSNIFDSEDPFEDQEQTPPKRRKSKRQGDGGNELLFRVSTWLTNNGYQCVPSSGIWKTPESYPVRSKSISKRALVRKLWMREAIPEAFDQRQDVLIAAMEEIAEQKHAAAWEALNERINTYVPWPDGYNPFIKFLRAIGDDRLFSDEDGQQALDKECGMRHIWWQMKQVVSGRSTKEHFPLCFLAYGPGETGKSSIIQLALSPLKDFAFNDTFDLIMDKFKQKRASQSPAIFLDEMERADKTTAAAFKNFVTSQSIMARGMYSEDVPEDDNIATLFLATNDEPPFGFYDTSTGIARRILLLPCTQVPYVKRAECVEAFTYKDALAMFQGIELDAPPPILERKARITESQKVMQAPSFARRWLDNRTRPFATEYDKETTANKRARRLHFDEVQESMRDFKSMEGTHERILQGRYLKRELELAGATVRKDRNNNFFLVSHRLRTDADRVSEDDDLT